MNCEICFEIYTKTEHKPYTLIPCGHTYCIECIEKVKSLSKIHKCSQCSEIVQEYKPSYAILKILEQNLDFIDFSNIKLKQVVVELINQINDTKTNIYLLKEKKLQNNQYKINVIKNEISNHSTDLLNTLLNNQESINKQADTFHKNLCDNLTLDSAEEETYLNEVSSKELGQLERGELNNIKLKLNKMKSNLTFKANLLNEIDLGLESNNFFNMENFQIGEIKMSQPSNQQETANNNGESTSDTSATLTAENTQTTSLLISESNTFF